MSGTADAIREEIARIAAAIEALLSGAMAPEAFRRIRVIHGIYPVRGGTDRYLLRVRIPLGRPSPPQLRALAQTADRYAGGRPVHLTTRQDVHIYGVAVRDIPDALKILAAAELSTREACGDTVRNVVVCPFAGILPGESFDVSPIAETLGRHLHRHPLGQRLPRKFKIAFEGCPEEDHVALPFQDVGARALLSPSGEPGFRVTLAGGLGALPRPGILLEPFTPAGDLAATVEAVLRLFDRHGNRENRGRARLKFVAAALGEERFREAVLRARDLVREAAPGGAARLPEPAAAPAAAGDGGPPPGLVCRWPGALVQKQPVLAALPARIPLGDLAPDRLRRLADLAEENGAAVRLTPGQGILLADVRRDSAERVAETLLRIGLRSPSRVVLTRCAGTDTCTVGTTRVRQVAAAIEKEVLEEVLGAADAGEADKISVAVSGCPNGCGRHLTADIGLMGVSRSIGAAPGPAGRLAPHYTFLIGGRTDGSGVRLGAPVGRVPARRAAEAVRRAVALIRAEARPGERASETISRLGAGPFAEALEGLLEAPHENYSEEDFFDLGPDGPVPFPPDRTAPRAP